MRTVGKIAGLGMVLLATASLVACGGDSSESAPVVDSAPVSTDSSSAATDDTSKSTDSPDSAPTPEIAGSVQASDADCAAILRFFEENGLFLDSNPDVALAAELIDGFLNAVTDELRADAEFIVDAYQRMLDVTVANGGDHIVAMVTQAGRDALEYFNNSGRYDLEQKIVDYYILRCPQWQ